MVNLKLGIQINRHWDEILGTFWTVSITDGQRFIQIKHCDTIKEAEDFVTLLGEFSESISK